MKVAGTRRRILATGTKADFCGSPEALMVGKMHGSVEWLMDGWVGGLEDGGMSGWVDGWIGMIFMNAAVETIVLQLLP